MQLYLKDETININGLTVQLLAAIGRAMLIWQEQGMDSLVITSANDGEHKEGSLHYEGNAVDIRTRTLPDSVKAADRLRSVLHQDYDVLLYPTHVHVEWDPK